MDMKEVRLLRADEIECRIGVINKDGLSLLLFKDVRTDRKILNETFGMFGWRNSYQSINGELFCTVEVYDEKKGEWIGRQDTGSASFSDAEKGRATDAMKRASFGWNIGAELYTSPFIYLKSDKYVAENTDKGFKVKDRFKVTHIEYNDAREISELIIENQRNEIVYEYKERKRRERQPQMKISIEQVNKLYSELDRTGVLLEDVLNRYGISSIVDMSSEMFSKAMRSLNKTKGKAA